MSGSSKKNKKPQQTRALRSLRLQQMVAVSIGVLIILSMIIGLVTTY